MNNYEFPELTVLIGEDYALIRDFLAQMFDLLNVKRIDIVENGEIVIQLASENAYDLILVDLNMPIKSGYDVVHERAGFKGKPIIAALTASTLLDTKEECLAAGMDDFLTKPIVLDDLVLLLVNRFKEKAIQKE